MYKRPVFYIKRQYLFHVKERKKLKIHNLIGRLGEDLACKFLLNKGFRIIDRNYREKWGEIDIVAIKGKNLSFFEVKSVSDETINQGVTQETSLLRPEERVDSFKLKKMARVIQSYLIDRKVSDETVWDFNVLSVIIDQKNKVAKVKFIENEVIQ